MQLETQPTLPQKDTISQQSPRKGRLFVLSAPSGTGKDTVINALKERGMDFHVVASVTTRTPRPGESDGHPYYFVDQETFDSLVAHDELVEYARVHGNWYGQPRRQIEEHLQTGQDVLLKIDVQGAATIRKKLPDAIFIFLTPGSVQDLSDRLIARQTETEQERQRRLLDAQNELAQKDHYDYVIENRQGQLEEAVERLRALLSSQSL